jgi:hypothetical protein
MKNDQVTNENVTGVAIPNGAAAAAILSAGAGCFSISICAWLGDASPTLAHFFNFYNPTGPLSGVTTTAIIIWLLLWAGLSRAWGGKTLPMKIIFRVAILLLGMGFLLSFPPFGDLLHGK